MGSGAQDYDYTGGKLVNSTTTGRLHVSESENQFEMSNNVTSFAMLSGIQLDSASALPCGQSHLEYL